MNVEIDGSRVPVLYGYPATSVYKQSIYSSFADLKRKVLGGGELVAGVRPALERVGFVAAKSEMKFMLTGEVPEKQIGAVLKIVGDLEEQVRSRRLAAAGSADDAE